MNEELILKLITSRPARVLGGVAAVALVVLLFLWVFTMVEPAGASVAAR
jgi:hypothetical protein